MALCTGALITGLWWQFVQFERWQIQYRIGDAEAVCSCILSVVGAMEVDGCSVVAEVDGPSTANG